MIEVDVRQRWTLPGAGQDVHVADQVEAAGCTVVILAPRERHTATLCRPASTAGSACALPTVTLSPEPDIEDVIRSVSHLVGQPVTMLRANAAAWDGAFNATAMIVEIDGLNAEPPGLRWAVLDERDIETIDPVWARNSLRAWMCERTEGWSELRPQWSRPGWLAEASQWMREQMTTAGYQDPEIPRIHYLWGVSAVLAAGSRTGSAFLKCSSDRFRHEARTTQALANSTPEYFPVVVAIEPDRGWLLMRDLGGTPLGDQPEPTWDFGIDALAALQQLWLGRTEELHAAGAELRPLGELVDWVNGTAHDTDLMGRLTKDVREDWLEATPKLVEACATLDRLGPGVSLVHGDFHPWNVVAGDSRTRIFDWTDAAVAHPFLDIVTYVMRANDLAVRRHLLERYLGHWSHYLPPDDLQRAGHLALVVGALYQAHTYTQLIPTVMPDDVSDLRDGDIRWMRRALDRSAHGIDGPY